MKHAVIAARQGIKARGTAMGKAFAGARLELDLKTLKPAFVDALPFAGGNDPAGTVQPNILSIVAPDKKEAKANHAADW